MGHLLGKRKDGSEGQRGEKGIKKNNGLAHKDKTRLKKKKYNPLPLE